MIASPESSTATFTIPAVDWGEMSCVGLSDTGGGARPRLDLIERRLIVGPGVDRVAVGVDRHLGLDGVGSGRRDPLHRAENAAGAQHARLDVVHGALDARRRSHRRRDGDWSPTAAGRRDWRAERRHAGTAVTAPIMNGHDDADARAHHAATRHPGRPTSNRASERRGCVADDREVNALVTTCDLAAPANSAEHRRGPARRRGTEDADVDRCRPVFTTNTVTGLFRVTTERSRRRGRIRVDSSMSAKVAVLDVHRAHGALLVSS